MAPFSLFNLPSGNRVKIAPKWWKVGQLSYGSVRMIPFNMANPMTPNSLHDDALIIVHSFGPLPVISTYNPVYRMYTPIYSELYLINGQNCIHRSSFQRSTVSVKDRLQDLMESLNEGLVSAAEVQGTAPWRGFVLQMFQFVHRENDVFAHWK